MELKFDPNAMSLADLEDFEAYTGLWIDDAFVRRPDGRNMPRSAKVLTALIWIVRRQDDPSFTIEQARATRATDIELDIANPTSAAATPTPTSAKRKRAAAS